MGLPSTLIVLCITAWPWDYTKLLDFLEVTCYLGYPNGLLYLQRFHAA